MSLAKKILLGLVALVVLLVAAAAVFVYTFDANRYRGVILAQLSRSVSRPVEAADLELRLLPLRLRLNQVRVPEDPAFAGEEFVRADAVQFDLSLWSLLRGETQVETLELDRPVVYLRQNAAGEWNVATLAAKPAPADKPATPPPSGAAPAEAPVRDWRLRDGTLVIERAGRPTLRLTGVELAVDDLSTTAAFPFELAVSFSPESRVSATGNLGPLDVAAPARTPLDARVTMENFRPAALATLVAVPPELGRLGTLGGTVTVRATPEEIVLGGRASLLGAQAGENVDVELMGVTLPADFSAVKLDGTIVAYRGARVRSTGAVTLTPATSLDLAIETSDADLAALQAIPPRLGYKLPPLPPATGKLTAELKASGALSNPLLTGAASFRDLTVALEGFSQPLQVKALELKLEPERITAAPFALAPEPGVSLTLSGAVTNYRTEPAVNARVAGGEVPLGPLLALAERFGVKLLAEGQQLAGFVQPDLAVSGPLAEPGRMSYAGTLKFRALSVKIPELARPVEAPALSLQVDPQRLVAAPFTLSPEPGLKLTVAATVEDYRGAGRLQARVTGEEVPLAPLLALAKAFGKNPLPEGCQLAGRVRPAIDLSGPLAEPAKLGYEGTLGFRDLAVTAPQVPEPIRIAALDLALNPTRLSAEPFVAQLGQKLSARIGFRLDNYQTKPAVQAHVETDAADLEALLGLARALGTDPLPGGRATGRVTAAVDARGLLGEKAPPLELSGRAELAGASVQLAALTQPLGIEQADVEFAADRLQVTNLRLAAAGAKVQGSLGVANFDAPRVSFEFRGDRLDTDALAALFGAAPPSTAPPAAPAKRRRVSELFLPRVYAQEKTSDWFARLSGRGQLEFDQVKHGTLTLGPVAAPVAISNQVVTCDPVQFGLYEGGGRGRLVVDLAGEKPAVEFNGLLRNVDANKLLSENSESKNRLHGRLGGTVTLRFKGSERPQIVRTAKGQGEVTLVNGRLAQLNLSKELAAVGQLAGLSLDQRDTPIEDMASQFTLADGWVRTDNLTLRSPDLTMVAAGGFSLEDELNFEGTAVFSPEASQRISSRSPLGGFLTDDQGRVVVPFLVRGTFAAPKIVPDAKRLLQMKVGGGSGGLRDILERIRKPKETPK